jgi:N-acylglucosamine-6-phosphate 2-epimerase
MTHQFSDPFERIDGGLIASVQAMAGSPLREPTIIAALSAAVLRGGVNGLRINGAEDIAAVRATTKSPIIGLHKVHNGTRNVITPELAQAAELRAAGADVIAVDATQEVFGADFSHIGRVVQELGSPVMADVSTLEEGLRAWDSGAAVVGTTLSGYTPQSARASDDPDVALVAALAEAGVRVIAEGRFKTPAQVSAAFEAGAFAVVVGGAITDPAAIAASFVRASPRAKLLSK